jgi:hypothetical protein
MDIPNLVIRYLLETWNFSHRKHSIIWFSNSAFCITNRGAAWSSGFTVSDSWLQTDQNKMLNKFKMHTMQCPCTGNQVFQPNWHDWFNWIIIIAYCTYYIMFTIQGLMTIETGPMSHRRGWPHVRFSAKLSLMIFQICDRLWENSAKVIFQMWMFLCFINLYLHVQNILCKGHHSISNILWVITFWNVGLGKKWFLDIFEVWIWNYIGIVH